LIRDEGNKPIFAYVLRQHSRIHAGESLNLLDLVQTQPRDAELGTIAIDAAIRIVEENLLSAIKVRQTRSKPNGEVCLLVTQWDRK